MHKKKPHSLLVPSTNASCLLSEETSINSPHVIQQLILVTHVYRNNTFNKKRCALVNSKQFVFWYKILLVK